MVDSGQADLSANFSLNTEKTDLSANVTIRNVTQQTGYNPHASSDLSVNFTIAQNTADLSANFTLNHQKADLSANVTIHNILSYFQHAIESPTGTNFITPQPLENYVIRQANRDKITTIDVQYSNVGDRFSWVTPASLLQVFAGTNVNNKTKIFGGYVTEPNWTGEAIIIHGQGYDTELLRNSITSAIYDIEASDLIKFHLLDLTTGIDTSQFSFVGEETTRTGFHSDAYADEANIESSSNVSLSSGEWTLDADNGGYLTTGYIISDDLVTDAYDYFDDVKITLTGTTPSGTSFIIKACNDDGTTYETFTDATWGAFTDHHSSTTNHGRRFKYKIEFISDGNDTPTLSQIDIEVKTKNIKVYERVEYDDESLLDAIKDVLYDASLEGYVDPNGIYQLDYVKSKSTTDFIPYLRQGYEILKQPMWKKDSRNLINSIEGIGADEGSLTKAEQDQWTEGYAGDWTGGACTITNETNNTLVKEGNYCIKAELSGTGWLDEFTGSNGDLPNADRFDWYCDNSETPKIYNNYLRAYCYPKRVWMCFDKTNYSLGSDNYDIQFKFYMRQDGDPQGHQLIILFDKQANIPVDYDTHAEFIAYGLPFIYCATSGDDWFLNIYDDGSRVYYSSLLTAGWNTLRIKRVSTTVTVYVNGEQHWSDVFTEGAGVHDNMQIGITAASLGYEYWNIDEMSYNYSAEGSTVLSPAFNKNLDLYEHMVCFYRQIGTSAFTIRVETDASNYFSKTLTPQKVSETYELKLPIGSKAAGWSSTGSPDWTNITRIRFVYGVGSNISIVYYDKLYFTVKPIAASYQDDDSITSQGTFQGKRYVNKQITSISELDDRLKIIVDAHKNLHEPLDVIIYGRRDLTTGDLVKVNFPKSGVNDVVFRVDEVHYLLGTMTLTRLFCRDLTTVSMVHRLKQLDYETKQIT